jgi:hypothetical protein
MPLFAALLVLLLAESAFADPILYIDRAAFLNAATNAQGFSLDTIDRIPTSDLVSQLNGGLFQTTYQSFLRVTYDAAAFNPNFVGGRPPGSILFGAGGGFTTVLESLAPVTAFGFDIAQDASTVPPSTVNGISLAGLTFLGWVSDVPFRAFVVNGADASGSPSIFSVNNMLIERVPEPSTVVLLLCAIVLLIGNKLLRVSGVACHCRS